MKRLRALWAFLYRPAIPCHRCGRLPSLMGGQVAEAYRTFCFECHRRHILGKQSIMQPQADFRWPGF